MDIESKLDSSQKKENKAPDSKIDEAKKKITSKDKEQ